MTFNTRTTYTVKTVRLAIRLSLVYTSIANCRRQSPTVLSLEQATTGVIASCRSNALELSESINSCPTERQNDPSTEFKFKCKLEFELNFFIELYLHREITLYVLFEWPQTLSACSYRVSLYAWVYIRYWLACAYHLFQSFRRCFSLSSTFCFCGFCNQGGGGIHKVVILDVW